MYSVKYNIRQLAALMLRHGIQDVVISPGSRNMPLAQTFAGMGEMRCYPVTDERSAGFFALGIAQRRNVPVAVCVTSGSALLNLASAVSEAYYQQVPLLVISADRPQAWIGQMDGQTLPQTGVFGTLVRMEANLCEPSDDTQRWYNNRLINESLIALTAGVKGPVHINVPITEPFFDCSATDLPEERMIRLRKGVLDGGELSLAWQAAKAPLLVVGQLDSATAEQLSALSAGLPCPVLCESLSNLRGERLIRNFDLTLISDANRRALAPDMVLYVGGHLVSKRLKLWLRSVRPSQCWRLSPEGAVADTFQCLTDVIVADIVPFIGSLACEASDAQEAYRTKWEAAERATLSKRIAPSLYSSVSVSMNFCTRLPHPSVLVLANSSAVRYAQLADLPQGVSVYCNRGVNGIDGSLSSAVGIASADPSQEVFLLIGDLSFFYDMNALWNNHLPANLHILLLNNGGGGIFRNLKGLKDTDATRAYVMATHHASAKGWVESIGCAYYPVFDEADFLREVDAFMDKGGQPKVMEVFTDAQTDEQAHQLFYRQFE